MTEWFDFFLQRMSYAAAGGGLALLVAYSITRWAPGLPPIWRVWVLRLSVIKLCISLLPLPAIGLLAAANPSAGSLAYSTGYSSQAQIALCFFFVIWLIGAGIELARILFAIRGAHVALQTAYPVEEKSTVRACRTLAYRLRLKRVPEVLVHPAFASPGLLGGTQSRIVLPMSDYPEDRLTCALAHELAHLKHKDLAWGWLMAVADILFWFHPLLMLTKREMLHWQEAAADEVAAKITRNSPATYAESLVAFAAECRGGRSMQAVFSVAGDMKRMERRLVTLFRREQRSRAGWLLGCLLLTPAATAMLPWSVYSVPAEATPVTAARTRMMRPPGSAEKTYSPASQARVAAPVATDAVRAFAPSSTPVAERAFSPGGMGRLVIGSAGPSSSTYREGTAAPAPLTSR